MKLKRILVKHEGNLALIIGNGVNRYGTSGNLRSWDAIVKKLAKRHSITYKPSEITSISLTEFYDLLVLQSNNISDTILRHEFCELISNWHPNRQHKIIARWAKFNMSPILTTNFDNNFGLAVECDLCKNALDKFSDYYPWGNFFGIKDNINPCNNFAIWHINGMQNYMRSLRLGLSHYMGSVQRVRGWLHSGNNRLFAGSNQYSWAGANTWLQIVFHMPLLIIGIGLNQEEVFLRWLLIERAKYHHKFPKLKQPAWYVYAKSENDIGKNFFMRNVGVTPCEVLSFEEIYDEKIWEC